MAPDWVQHLSCLAEAAAKVEQVVKVALEVMQTMMASSRWRDSGLLPDLALPKKIPQEQEEPEVSEGTVLALR